MFNIIQKAKKQSQWVEEIIKKRRKEQEQYARDKASLPPSFNRQHFAVQGQGGVVITGAALKVMEKNTEHMHDLEYQLTSSEIVSMKSVVEGLTMIHHGETYIKEILSHVVCLESYEPMKYVKKKRNSEETYCYYVIAGSAEVTYDGRHGQSLTIFKSDVIYTHATGEYMGLISSVGPEKDLAPPASVYTIEACEFLKINREIFHKRLKRLREEMDRDKLEFLGSGISMLSELSAYLRESLVKFMVQEKYDANTIVLHQGELSEYVFFLAKGHCSCLKKVYLPTVQREIILTIGQVEVGEFFGEERVTHDQTNYCNIISKSPLVCFKVYRGAFEARGSLRNELMKLMRTQKHQFPPSSVLRVVGLEMFKWEMYKRMEATVNKDVHENRQMILHCDNLRLSKDNKMCDFMAGNRDLKDLPEEIMARNLLEKNRCFSDMYSSVVNLTDDAVIATTQHCNSNDQDVYELLHIESEEESVVGDENQTSERKLKKKPKKKKEFGSQDTPNIFTMTSSQSGHMTISAGMTSKEQTNTLQSVMDSDSEEENFVVTDTQEIIQKAKQEAALYKMKMLQKRQQVPHLDKERKSVFKYEFERSKTMLAVSKYRASILARKLRRTRKEHEKAYQAMQNISKSGKEEPVIELSVDFEQEAIEASDTITEFPKKKNLASELPTIDSCHARKKSISGAKVVPKREKFLRRLSIKLSEGESFLPIPSSKIPSNGNVKKTFYAEDNAFQSRSKSFTGQEILYNHTLPKTMNNQNHFLMRRRTLSSL